MNYSNKHLMSEEIRRDLPVLENTFIYINELLAAEFVRFQEVSVVTRTKPSTLQGYLSQV